MPSTMGKKLVNLQGLPYMPLLNSVNFGPKTAENGWRVFAYPLNFRIGRRGQPYRINVILQIASKLWHVLCSGTSLQFRTTECRRAHAELCHASSLILLHPQNRQCITYSIAVREGPNNGYR